MLGSKSVKVTDTAFAAANVSKVIVAENVHRLGIVIYNNSSNSCYITYGPTSSSASCTRILASFAQYESFTEVAYTGIMSAIRNAGTGNITVTELI